MSGYVNMGDNAPVPGTTTNLPPQIASLGDDPNLSQEDRDLRLAIALQQQENAAAYDAHKKRNDTNDAAKKNRTTRSGASTGLAAIRRSQKTSDEAPLGYNSAAASGTYNAPGSEDGKLAAALQHVEQSTVGTAQMMKKIVQQEKDDKISTNLRSTRSKATI